MKTSAGHLTYCTNIHAGEEWKEHFDALKQSIPAIRRQLGWEGPFGIGLRLSNKASLALAKEENLQLFRRWLEEQDSYVFTMNGFPYGSFHRQHVKDQVHAPDWTTNERLQYTLRMFRILAALLPEGMEGGISTSPLSYKPWFEADEPALEEAMEKATWHIVQVAEHLVRTRRTTGALLHLDLEPEPDGLIESGAEFISWYENYLLPAGIPLLMERTGLNAAEAEEALKTHVQLCYDVCHFSVGYESLREVAARLSEKGICIGKIQLSAALKVLLPDSGSGREKIAAAFETFNESTYLHQVIAACREGNLIRYPDLPQALPDIRRPEALEWRSHFHVPLFIEGYGLLQSTQESVKEILEYVKEHKLTDHLEAETYTWEVLPEALRMPLDESIARELQWILDELKAESRK